MRNKRIIIVLAILLLTILSGIIIYYKNQKRIYHTPIVAFVTIDEEKIAITAGIYRYGDISLDGKIDSSDVRYMELLLNANMKFLDDQKELADFDQNGVVDNRDLELLKKYLKNDRVVTYDINNKKLLYCVSKTNTSDNCSWQNDSVFKLDKNIEYYVYAQSNKNISKSYNFTYDISGMYEETGLIETDEVE